MTTKRIPLCQTKGCPHPSDPDWHVPICGHGLAYEHHHTKKRSRGGALSVQVCICPRCHHQIDNGPWMDGVYDHKDGTVHYFIKDAKGEDKCDVVIGEWKKGEENTIEAAPIHAELSEEPEVEKKHVRSRPIGSRLPALKNAFVLDHVPDEQLAALFAEADKRQAEGFLLKCRIVSTYRERHVQAWGSSWAESAYELFHVSRRTLEVYARLHEILASSDNYLVEQIAPLTDSRGLMRHIGTKTLEDGKKALEAAVAYQAEFAEPPTVAALQHKLGVEAKPPEGCPKSDIGHMWCCIYCGKER